MGHRPLIGLIGLIPLMAIGGHVGRPLGRHPHPGAITRLGHYRKPSSRLLRLGKVRLRPVLQLMLWLRLLLRLGMKGGARKRAGRDRGRRCRPLDLLGGRILHNPAPSTKVGRGQVGRLPLEALRDRIDRVGRNR